MRRGKRGVALLEALVALAILSAAGLGAIGLLGAGLRAERDARERERTLATEERVLAAMTLLNRDELDQRIGRRTVGEFVVGVQRPERTLYRMAIGERQSAQVEDLVTVVFRRDPNDP